MPLPFADFQTFFQHRFTTRSTARRHLRPAVLLCLAAGLLAPQIGHGNSVLSWGRQVIPPPEELSPLVDVAAGGAFNVGLRPGGIVVTWGANNYRQSTVPEGLSDVRAVAAGAHHAMALRRDGTVVAWGDDRDGRGSVPEGLSDVIRIQAGQAHNLALLQDGTVVAWGNNRHNQTDVPEELEDVVAIAAGVHHNLALQRDGTVVAWGQNEDGQATVPEGLTEVTALAAGRTHSLALRRDGSVVAWGNDAFGQSSTPPEARDIVRIAAGEDHNLALRSDGTVLSWGRNHYGQTELPDDLGDARRIAAGANHNVVLLEDGSFVAWGSNDAAQSINSKDLEGVISVSTWENHTVALKEDGSVLSWGTTISAGIQPDQRRLRNIVSVAAGRAHGLALRRDGTVVGWGDNLYGQASPPPDLRHVVAIAAGEFHSLALQVDGKVVGWGNNFHGQADVPEHIGTAIAVSAGQAHSMALLHDGTVASWGNDFYGQAAVPEGLDGVKAIAAGSFHSLALRHDGTVEAWGSDLFGQTSLPRGLSDAVAIEASSSHSIAIRENRELVVWGSNYFGQSNPPQGVRQVAEAGAGGARTVVVMGDLQPPRLVVDFPAQRVLAGDTLSLVAFADGTPPLHYQWLKDGRPLQEATGPALYIENVDARASGTYSVIIANAAGNTRSRAFPVEVQDPAVVVEVEPEIAVPGETASFVARAAGTEPLRFQWKKDGEPIEGIDGNYLSIEEVNDAYTGVYTVEVSNEFGSAVSEPVHFFVAPRVRQQPPELVAARIGERLVLELEADGSQPLEVQWYRDGEPLPDGDGPTLVLENISVEDGGVYSAEVSNQAGRVATETTLLQIVPHIVFQPEAQVFSEYGGTAVFEVRAVGTPPLTYLWHKDGEELVETDEPRLVLEQVTVADVGQYHAVVMNEAGQTESDPAPLVLPPSITRHPMSTTVRAGETAEFSVQVEGSSPIEFQWLKDEEPLPGADSQRLRVESVDGQSAGRYSVRVSNEVGSETSESAMLAVAPSIVAAPEPVAAGAGDSVELYVEAEGSRPLYFQWVKDGDAIDGANSSRLSLENISSEDAGDYSVVISNSAGIAVSEDARVEVQPAPQFGTRD